MEIQVRDGKREGAERSKKKRKATAEGERKRNKLTDTESFLYSFVHALKSVFVCCIVARTRLSGKMFLIRSAKISCVLIFWTSFAASSLTFMPTPGFAARTTEQPIIVPMIFVITRCIRETIDILPLTLGSRVAVPVITDETTNGVIIIFNILKNIFPGNPIHLTVSLEGSARRSVKPRRKPKSIPTAVRTNKMFSLNRRHTRWHRVSSLPDNVSPVRRPSSAISSDFVQPDIGRELGLKCCWSGGNN